MWLHPSWAAQGHFSSEDARRNGGLNLGALDERLSLSVRGQTATSVWLNITRDQILNIGKFVITVHVCLAFCLWVECPSWNSLWQPCIIQTAAGASALTLMLFCLKQLVITAVASGSSLAIKFASGRADGSVWLRDSLAFGLCNIDVWLRQVGRRLDGDLTSPSWKF